MLSKITNIIKDGGLGAASASSKSSFAVVGVSSVVPAGVVGISNPSEIADTFGDGPLRDFLEGVFSLSKPDVYCKAVAGTIAGTAGAVTAVKASSGTVAVSGSPKNDYKISVEIVEGGGLNTGAFAVTIDGVPGARVTIPQAGTYEIPGTGLTITFTPGTPAEGVEAYVEGDTFSFSTTAPSASNAELLAAIDEIVAGKLSISALYVAGVTTNAFWAAFAAKLAVEEAKNNFLFGYCQARYLTDGETASVWAGLLAGTERGATVNARVGVVAGWYEGTDSISGQVDLRPALGKFAGRLAAIDVQQNPDHVGLGAITGINKIMPEGISDADINRLQEAGYVMLRTYYEVLGIYFAAGRLLTDTTSDYKTIANRRTMDEACRGVAEQQIRFLNTDTGVAADGSPEGLAQFKAMSEMPLRNMKAAGQISDGSVEIPEGQNILSTETLKTKVRIVPRGKISYIENEISFYNPAIEAE